MKKALITGIFGQDGSYLCEILANKGYEVHGIIKDPLSHNSQKIKNYLNFLGVSPHVHSVDLNSYEELKQVIIDIHPDEIYHLAAFHMSAEDNQLSKSIGEKYLFDYNVKSTSNLLCICYEHIRHVKFVAAGSCLMFDASDSLYQNEKTPFKSRSLYGLAKISENMLLTYYRNKGLHASTAILFNHESSRRSDNFVTKKIVKSLVAISKGEINSFTLGDLEVKKDWGWARDYAYGMYLIAQGIEPKDYVLSSGKGHTIRYFADIVSNQIGLVDWQKYVLIDENILTRRSYTVLLGDSSLARDELNWQHSMTLEQLVHAMVENELSGVLI
ncbi:NAD dependent epimerase/dehydratase family protein [Synechococcus sp. A18-40]|nr:NAD dependent epimerase/dehydratase family protein [Synechococcus sp. A18-40]